MKINPEGPHSTGNFHKTLVSFFLEERQGAYNATVYRYENGLDELSYLSEIIKTTHPTKTELKKLKEDLKMMEKNIISYFTSVFKGDITQTSFPIPLTSEIRNTLNKDIFNILGLFLLKSDLIIYEKNEEGYFLNISFIKGKKGEIKLGKVKISENQEEYKNYEERVKNNEKDAIK